MNDENGDNKDKTGMNILKKIIATIRIESRELTDVVMGSYGAIKIEQEFESAQFKLKHAKQALTDMMGKQRQSSRVFDITVDKISQLEALIDVALKQGDEAQAMIYALNVVDLEINKDIQIESLSSITTNIGYLQRQLEQSERELKEFSRQLVMLKTTENVQKATETIMGNIDAANADLMSAKKSLDRIREKHKSKNNHHEIEAQMVKDYSLGDSEHKTTRSVLKDSRNKAQDVIKRIQDKL